MTRYLLDANHLGAALARVSPLRERIHAAHRQGARFGTIVPVLCEVQAGLQFAKRPASCIEQLNRLLAVVRIWPLEPTIAEHYGKTYAQLKLAGRVLSQVDLLLAAACRQSGWVLLTTDRDFEALPDIRQENWLIPLAK